MEHPTSGLDRVLSAVARTAARLCEARDCRIYLAEGGQLRLAVQHGPRRPVPYPGYGLGETRPISRRTALGVAILDRRTIHERDMTAATRRFPDSPSAAQRIAGVRTRTLLAAPLLRDGQVVGGIVIRRTVVRPFTPRQISLLETFADQAALAIDNARLSEELRERNRALGEALEQQTATSDVLRVISSSPTDLQSILDVIAERAVRLCDGMFGSVYRFDGELIHMVAHHNYSAVALELSRRRFPTPPTRGLFTARAILERAVVHVPDVEHAADYIVADLVAAAGFRSVLSVPMLRDGKPVGAITVWRAASGPFADRQVALLQTFADQAVIAIENVRLFTELQQRNRELSEALERQTATSEILQVISSSPTDTQPVFDTIVGNAVTLCGALYGMVWRYDGALVQLVGHHDLPPEELDELRRVFPQPAARMAFHEDLRRGVVKNVRDVETASEVPAEVRARWRRRGVRSVLVAPMRRGDEVIGAIGVSHREIGAFSPSREELLKTFADQAVIAIENVRLFTELQARNRDLSEALEQQTATSEILRVISSSPTDIQPVFATLATSAARLCDAFDAAIHRIDGDVLRLVAHEGPIEPDAVLPLRQGTVAGHAIREQRTLQVADLQAEEDAYPLSARFARNRGFKTILAVPMLRGAEALGTITIRRTEVRPFTDRQAELLRTFADQAVIAIENVRLFTELQARNRELTEALEQQTATSEILRVISQSQTDVRPVFDTIVESAARLCDGVFSTLLSFDGELLHLVATHNWTPTGLDVARRIWPARPSRQLVTSRAILERTVVHVSDVELEYREGEPRELVRTIGYRSVLAVPMLRDGVPLGVIAVGRAEPGLFADNQIALLKTFADQAVIAIENVRLFTELQGRNHELTEALEQQTATSEILGVISSSPTDVQPVFDAIAASAVRLCAAAFGCVFRFDGELLHFVAQHRFSVEAIELMQRQYPRPPSGLNASVIVDRTVVHSSDVLSDPRTMNPELARALGYRSFLGVPMMREGRPIGLIAIFGAEARPFSDKQIALLQTFAAQAVIAVENVRLFSELDARNRDLTQALEQQTATSEILRVISSSPTDLQPVMDAVAASAARLCGASDTVIYRVEGDQLRPVAQFGRTPVVPLRIDRHTPTGSAVLDRRTVHIHDIAAVPAEEFPDTPARATGVRTLLSTPLLRQGVAIGAILIRRMVVDPFTDSQIDLLKTFADQAVIAIENVRLFTELQARTRDLTRSVEQLTALGEVSRALSSTLDLDAVLSTIVARARQLAGTDACTVHEYDEQAEEFHLRATHNLNEEVVVALRRAPVRKGEGAAGRMAVTREPVHIADITEADAYHGPLRDVLLRSGARAVLTIPLLREDHLIGGLTVTRKTPGEFPPETIELLKTFATQSALAIQNARLFREIEDKSRQLEVASRHKSQFLANMSHELRTPLNAILGYTELIADNIYGEVPERMREVLERVDKSGRHLLGLINDVLDLSKIEAGQLMLALTDYSLADVVQSVAASVGSLAAEKKLELAITVDPDLPLGRGDSRRLTQVLLNLVGNALKFTEAGRVAVEARREGESFLVSVTDTGPGIAPGDQERVFEEFQQVRSSKAGTKGGTGLGLAIARRIVQMHGGRLWLDSTLGQGSTFSFTVPVRVE